MSKQFSPLQRGSMDKGLELLSPETTAISIKADPRLKLLFELEPRYLGFLDNLADLLSPPKLPPLQLTSPPGEFWPDVFLRTEKPWRSFQESVIWHLVAIVMIWSISGKGWVLHREPQVRNSLSAAQHITYYPPSRSYSARASRPVPRPHSKARSTTPHQKPMEVAREAPRRPGSLTVPPDLKTAMARPNLGSGPVPPSVPLAATTRSSNLPAGLSSVVAPPPDIKDGNHAGAGLQASVVAPPPDANGISAGHAAISPNAAVISPPPTLQTWMRKIESLLGDSGGKGAVVPPPPSISGTDGGRAGSLGVGSPQIVAPPPSVDGVGGPGGGRSLTSTSNIVPPPPSVQGVGRGRGNGLASGGSAVVPPPPSLQGGSGTRGTIGSLAAGSGGIVPPPPGVQGVEGGRGSMLSAGSPSVVPPPPSMEARGGLGGSRSGGSQKSSLNGTGSDIVPPPPSMQGLGGGGNSRSAAAAGPGGAGNRNALGGLGGDIVPPPPAFDRGSGGGSGGGKGHTAGMQGTGSGIVPPPPSMQGVGAGGAGGRIKSLSAGGGPGVIPPPPSVSGTPGGTGRMAASMSGTGSGSGVVPPPPAISGEGPGGSGNGRLAGMNGAPGAGPAPPPPSTSGMGGGGTGNGSMASLGGPASAAPPGGSAGNGSGASGSGGGSGSGFSGSTGPLQQMDDIPDANIPPNPNEPAPGPAEEFPLRLVSLPLSTQGSSFFSNYEAFIAERRLQRGQSQLIKLVYTFLPYQKRLSEYIQSNARVYTLRVIRKPECDESLMQMTWSDTSQDTSDMFPGTDKNMKLPCYVTTADDYQRALDRGR